MGRTRIHCDNAQRQAAYRNRRKAQKALHNGLHGQLILELFPGAGMFGKAFEELGACVVRGPDILHGGDVREFIGIKGRFDGIIGGPPCQVFSRAAISGSNQSNLIPEFERIVAECEPTWAIMENVREAHQHINWPRVFLRDWDCGGLTHRRRGFWFQGIDPPPKPNHRQGEASYSVLASNWNRRGVDRISGHRYLTAAQAATLQGFCGLDEKIMSSQPGWKRSNGHWVGIGKRNREIIATHMLGNGVPRALGLYVARWVAFQLAGITNSFADAIQTEINAQQPMSNEVFK